MKEEQYKFLSEFFTATKSRARYFARHYDGVLSATADLSARN